jgi:type VI secretion system protein ImpE
MGSNELLQDGQLCEALDLLKEEIRQSPSDVELRVRLFALNCLLGRWDKASDDLGTIKVLDESWVLPGQVYQKLIIAEAARSQVFAGKLAPLLMEEPAPWLSQRILSFESGPGGGMPEDSDVQTNAWGSAPKSPCRVDGRPCPWLQDADSRLGPVLEAHVDGQYYWIPFDRLQKIEITPPEFLVEVVWVPARLRTLGGTELTVHLPARYPGTQDSSDGSVCLGQKTVWIDAPAGGKVPLGQKLIESDGVDFGLLSCRDIEFEPSADPRQELDASRS